MKTTFNQPLRETHDGFVAVVVVLAILGIMILLVAANTSNLIWLHKEVRLVDERQTLWHGGSATNLSPAFPRNKLPAAR